MALKIHELTPAGHIKKLSYSTIVNTVLIYKSFKYCKVLLTRNGSEDHLLFDYNSLNKKKKNNRGNNIYNEDEIEIKESNNESENDLSLDDLEFNEYNNEELLNYENV